MSNLLNLKFGLIKKSTITGRTIRNVSKRTLFSKSTTYHLDIMTEHGVFLLYTDNKAERDDWAAQVDAVLNQSNQSNQPFQPTIL